MRAKRHWRRCRSWMHRSYRVISSAIESSACVISPRRSSDAPAGVGGKKSAGAAFSTVAMSAGAKRRYGWTRSRTLDLLKSEADPECKLSLAQANIHAPLLDAAADATVDPGGGAAGTALAVGFRHVDSASLVRPGFGSSSLAFCKPISLLSSLSTPLVTIGRWRPHGARCD